MALKMPSEKYWSVHFMTEVVYCYLLVREGQLRCKEGIFFLHPGLAPWKALDIRIFFHCFHPVDQFGSKGAVEVDFGTVTDRLPHRIHLHLPNLWYGDPATSRPPPAQQNAEGLGGLPSRQCVVAREGGTVIRSMWAGVLTTTSSPTGAPGAASRPPSATGRPPVMASG